MADILDATPTGTSAPTNPTPPVEPPPTNPITGSSPNAGTVPATPSDSLIVPPAAEPPPPTPAVPPATQPVKPPSGPTQKFNGKKRPGAGAIIAGLLLLLLTLPVAVFYISQQQSTSDVRSRAFDSVYPTGTPTNTPIPAGGTCQDGTGIADPDYWLICECGSEGCSMYNDTTPGGGGWGWVCNSNCRKVPRGTNPQGECTQIDNIRPGGQDYCSVVSVNCPESCRGGNPPGNTPTPTNPPSGPQCSKITVYKDNQAFTNYSSLKANDAIKICVMGGNEEKARLRVNGGGWTEVTAKNSTNEYCMDFTIPSGTTQFTIEAEVFGNGDWK